jgi:hypothetical protein
MGPATTSTAPISPPPGEEGEHAPATRLATTPAAPSPGEVRDKLRRLVPRVVTEMWRVMVLVYQAIHAALLPIALPDLPDLLDVFLEHIGRRNEKKRPKQTELFLKEVRPEPA